MLYSLFNIEWGRICLEGAQRQTEVEVDVKKASSETLRSKVTWEKGEELSELCGDASLWSRTVEMH